MSKMNFRKYEAYPQVDIKDRTWPDKTITRAPVWCSVDLRDGNQALSEPMSVDDKVKMFDMLVKTGFKEIEVGFPSASEIEFSFLRRLVDEKRIPDDVTIQILTQAREHLIRRSFEAIEGIKNVIVHVYNSTSRQQRDIVFGKSRDEIKQIAIEGTKLIRKLKEESQNRDGIRLEYSPESFTGTELDYAIEVTHAVMEAWGASADNRIILNLPSTVEMSSANVFADRIEWMCRQLNDRTAVIVSVHTHNDRGTAVASAELAVMAGADRVEGALFGNGERCGNMDLITMALNLYTQGVDPELDFSDIDNIMKVYVECTGMDVHARHPYVGELVYTAFSGSHQDAINKGMKVQEQKDKWDVPYLPIDPKDVGRSYEAIIRINSQSGKGGIAFVLEKDYGIKIPKWMQPDFSREVQKEADKDAHELVPEKIEALFTATYIATTSPYALKNCRIDAKANETSEDERCHVEAEIEKDGQVVTIKGHGSGPVGAFTKAIRESFSLHFSLEQYSEHGVTDGEAAKAMAYVMLKDGNGKSCCGAGLDSDISFASIKAVVSALNRMG